MYDPYIGQIIPFTGNFAPRGWALCDGQLLPISQNQALFSILGTTYGGDGRTTFALPDLRGRLPVHPGHGPGLSVRTLGQRAGSETVTLTANQLPSHSHDVSCTNGRGDKPNPPTNVFAGDPDKPYSSSGTDSMKTTMLTKTGGGGAHDNVAPFLCVNYIIALVGTFPSRS